MEVTLYTRSNCPLCEKAKEALSAAGVVPHEIDIDGDPELQRRFTDDVPVVFVDGVQAFRHRLTPERFREFVSLKSGCDWQVVNGHHLEKEFRFPDFAQALAFVNRIGAAAEELQHHPDIHLGWGRVQVTIWTHTIDGLSRKDYLLAAKIDQLSR